MSRTPPGVSVRPARAEDAEALLLLSRAAIQESAAEHYDAGQRQAWSDRRTLAQHQVMITRETAVVAEVEGAIAGFATVALDAGGPFEAGEVDQLFVDPRHGGRGVARLLLETVAGAARDAGLTSLVTHASWRSVPVFERMGYRREAVETVQVGDQQLTRARMRLDLPA